MLEVEAHWIAGVLASLPDDAFPLLNLGSGTAHFREREQPFIDRLIFSPLRATGREVIHADLKDQPGVDVVLDFTDSDQRRALSVSTPIRTILCSNVLEHLAIPPAEAARYIMDLCSPGGYVILTVPKRYGYHADPIDNGFRPSAEELAQLFPDCELITAKNVLGPVLAVHHARRGGWPRYLMRVAAPFHKPRAWFGHVYWFWRRTEAACLVMRKP